jgi:Zn ribbon nucleic-acid-binding protein
MDSIFEEDADEVGGEIEAYCPSPRCKADTTHTIISMYEDEVRRVQCVVCGEVHAYRKPRGDGEEAGEAAKAKRPERKVKWEDGLARATDADLSNCRPYSIRDTYEEGDVVSHPVFDIGFVTELLPDNKVAVIFREGEPRILVHNRGDLATRMPDISEIPAPREAKKKKRAKKPEPVAQPIARNKSQVEAVVEMARSAAQSRMDEAQRSADERNKRLKAEVKKGGKAPAAPAAPAAVAATPAPAAPATPAGKASKAKPAATAKAPDAAKAAPAPKAAAAAPSKAAKAAPPAKPAKAAKAAPAKATKAAPAKAAKAVKAAKPAKAGKAAKAAKPAKAGKAAKAAKPAKAKAKSAAKKPAKKGKKK